MLSLFDGISCGQIALNRVGIKYENYYASEIDKFAIKCTQHNYPNTIQLGDVSDWRSWDIDWQKIGLVSGGFPCQAWSIAGKQLGDKDERGKLFWVMLDIMKHVLTNNPEAKFLIENVKMKKEFEQYVTYHTEKALGKVEKHLINSALVSAQNRNRYYWTNIKDIKQPEDKGILLKDIIESGEILKGKSQTLLSTIYKENTKSMVKRGKTGLMVCVDRDKSHCLDANYFKGGNIKSYFEKNRRQLVFSREGMCHVADADINGNESVKRVYHIGGKAPTLTTMGGGHREPKILLSELKWRKLTPLECERLQTVPDNYTSILSNTQRYKCLGNGWTVDVIAHIFQGLKNDSIRV